MSIWGCFFFWLNQRATHYRFICLYWFGLSENAELSQSNASLLIFHAYKFLNRLISNKLKFYKKKLEKLKSKYYRRETNWRLLPACGIFPSLLALSCVYYSQPGLSLCGLFRFESAKDEVDRWNNFPRTRLESTWHLFHYQLGSEALLKGVKSLPCTKVITLIFESS